MRLIILSKVLIATFISLWTRAIKEQSFLEFLLNLFSPDCIEAIFPREDSNVFREFKTSFKDASSALLSDNSPCKRSFNLLICCVTSPCITPTLSFITSTEASTVVAMDVEAAVEAEAVDVGPDVEEDGRGGLIDPQPYASSSLTMSSRCSSCQILNGSIWILAFWGRFVSSRIELILLMIIFVLLLIDASFISSWEREEQVSSCLLTRGLDEISL